jgi:hypothetical protein
MTELERILALVQDLENDLVSDGVISDEGYFTDKFEEIKELLFKESIK